eukprot:scaffold20204_cov36-Phaeocystis_antarctica.AAC.2
MARLPNGTSLPQQLSARRDEEVGPCTAGKPLTTRGRLSLGDDMADNSQEIEGMLKGMLNIGGTPGAAAPPSADAARAALIADLQRGLGATQQSLAQLGARQQQLHQAAAALPTMPPEQQAHVRPQLVALNQQLQARAAPPAPQHASARPRPSAIPSPAVHLP